MPVSRQHRPQAKKQEEADDGEWYRPDRDPLPEGSGQRQAVLLWTNRHALHAADAFGVADDGIPGDFYGSRAGTVALFAVDAQRRGSLYPDGAEYGNQPEQGAVRA